MAVAGGGVGELGAPLVERVRLVAELVADRDRAAGNDRGRKRQHHEGPQRRAGISGGNGAGDDAKPAGGNGGEQQRAVPWVFGEFLDIGLGRVERVFADERVQQRHEAVEEQRGETAPTTTAAAHEVEDRAMPGMRGLKTEASQSQRLACRFVSLVPPCRPSAAIVMKRYPFVSSRSRRKCASSAHSPVPASQADLREIPQGSPKIWRFNLNDRLLLTLQAERNARHGPEL